MHNMKITFPLMKPKAKTPIVPRILLSCKKVQIIPNLNPTLADDVEMLSVPPRLLIQLVSIASFSKRDWNCIMSENLSFLMQCSTICLLYCTGEVM